jgi:hypothetical protein
MLSYRVLGVLRLPERKVSRLLFVLRLKFKTINIAKRLEFSKRLTAMVASIAIAHMCHQSSLSPFPTFVFLNCD